LYTEWIFSIGHTPKKEGISFVSQELPPFLYGSNPNEKTANSEGPQPPRGKLVIQTKSLSAGLFCSNLREKKKFRAARN
jgi:hypothetical protein